MEIKTHDNPEAYSDFSEAMDDDMLFRLPSLEDDMRENGVSWHDFI